MRHCIVVIYLVFLTIIVVSCNKTITQASLAGKWNIINDSIPVDRSGVENIGSGGLNYIGTKNDYYNFTIDSILYLKEGANLDTATYSVSNNKITLLYRPLYGAIIGNLSGFSGVSGSYTITNLTANTMTLSTSFGVQGGEETEVVNLKRTTGN